MRVAYVLDELFVRHRPPSAHPERPERLIAVRDALDAIGLAERARQIPIRAAREDELVRVHTSDYLAALERKVAGRSGWLDGDTYYSKDSWAAVLAAAGAAVDLSMATLAGDAQYGMALVRPPGHHAEPDRAMGFCLVNNVAVAAAAARAGGVDRVAIVDWDVHHGNGTQHMFYADPSVLYVSLHQYPFYPGTGAPTEVGAGPGAGATVNVALPAGCGDAEYLAAFTDVVVPELRRHRPQLILVSGGFDAYAGDPLAQMRVTVGGFADMARAICRVADEFSDGRVVFVLEGGYDLSGLSQSVAGVFELIASEDRVAAEPAVDAEPMLVRAGARDAIERTRAALARARDSRPPEVDVS